METSLALLLLIKQIPLSCKDRIFLILSHLSCGVPQGLVLGPILCFYVFIYICFHALDSSCLEPLPIHLCYLNRNKTPHRPHPRYTAQATYFIKLIKTFLYWLCHVLFAVVYLSLEKRFMQFFIFLSVQTKALNLGAVQSFLSLYKPIIEHFINLHFSLHC